MQRKGFARVADTGGCSKDTPPSEIDEAFRRACDELSYDLPKCENVVYEYVIDLARQYKEGLVDREELRDASWVYYMEFDDKRLAGIAIDLEVLSDALEQHQSESIKIEMHQAILDFLAHAESNPKSKIEPSLVPDRRR